jgi:hypothetical protein
MLYGRCWFNRIDVDLPCMGQGARMSIVPKEVVVELALTSGFSYDPETGHVVVVSGYTEVVVTPGLEQFANRAAEWALRQAAETCDIHSRMSGAECAAGIRALISPEGKVKGGESDEN